MLFTALFWRDVLTRAGRSTIQALVPTLLLITATGSITGVSGWAVLDLAGVAFVVTFAKSLVGLSVDPADSKVKQAVERALPAFFTTLLGFLTASGFSLLTADYRTMAIASVGSMVTALVHFYVDPPSVAGAGAAVPGKVLA